MVGADYGNGDGYEGEESGHCGDGECKEEPINTIVSTISFALDLWKKL
jgi:hypothetical protein